MPDGGPRILSNDGRNKKKCRALSCVVNEPSRLRILKWMEWLAYSKQKKSATSCEKKKRAKNKVIINDNKQREPNQKSQCTRPGQCDNATRVLKTISCSVPLYIIW